MPVALTAGAVNALLQGLGSALGSLLAHAGRIHDTCPACPSCPQCPSLTCGACTCRGSLVPEEGAKDTSNLVLLLFAVGLSGVCLGFLAGFQLGRAREPRGPKPLGRFIGTRHSGQ